MKRKKATLPTATQSPGEMLAMHVSANQGCVKTLYFISFMWWQCCDYSRVGFRCRNNLASIRKGSLLGLKIPCFVATNTAGNVLKSHQKWQGVTPQTRQEIFQLLFKFTWFCCHKYSWKYPDISSRIPGFLATDTAISVLTS